MIVSKERSKFVPEDAPPHPYDNFSYFAKIEVGKGPEADEYLRLLKAIEDNDYQEQITLMETISRKLRTKTNKDKVSE